MFRKNRKYYALLIPGIMLVQVTLAQDLHFSQFYNSPLTTNPANTGFLPDADYRIGGSYRNQWSTIMSVPYKTMSVFGDAQVFREKFDNGWMGLGGVVLSDVAGSGSLRSTKIYGSLAYHQMLNLSSLFSGGFNIGYVNKTIDRSKLKFPDQFDGKFFDNTLPTATVLNFSTSSYLDIQAGLNYAYFPKENMYFNVGYSIQHVNRPKETFFASSAENRVAMRHIGFLNGIFKANDRLILNPNAYFTFQAQSWEAVAGFYANYNLSDFGEKQLIAGLYYRYGDAVVPTIGIEINQIRFTFSYDVTTSSLSNFNHFQGANEMNIIKKGNYFNGGDKQTMCPSFNTGF